MKEKKIKVRRLAPVELDALEKAQALIKPMCDLLRMVHPSDWSPVSLAEDGEMRRRYFELEELLKKLPALTPMPEPVIGANGVETKESRATRDAVTAVRRGDLVHKPNCPEIFAQYGAKDCHCGAKARAAGEIPGQDAKPPKPMFAEHEKMKLGDGYSEHDKKRIKTITAQLVEGRVLKGEVNPENPEELKKAVMEAGHIARQVYNAALEYVSG